MSRIRTLWEGGYPLAETFWTWVITLGLLVNVTTSVLFLTFVMRDQPWIALLLGYGLSLPYNVIAVVGVWRAAARYDGPSLHADLARVATVVLMTALSVT